MWTEALKSKSIIPVSATTSSGKPFNSKADIKNRMTIFKNKGGADPLSNSNSNKSLLRRLRGIRASKF